MNKCKYCGYDNSLHEENKCKYCGKKIKTKKQIKGFNMSGTPPDIGKIIKHLTAQVYIKRDKLFIEFNIDSHNMNIVVNSIKKQYENYVETNTCNKCGGLFCDGVHE